ncbi:MAG: glycosyltransferase [Alteripontixanthobacter sp.]
MTQRVILWGTYDLGKPRTRIMRAALIDAGYDVVEIHASVWNGVADKSQLTATGWLARSLRWIFSYPGLIWRYLCAGDHDAVIVPYMGHFDAPMIALCAKLRGKPLIWDAFLSLYDTLVRDRRLIGPAHPAARVIRLWEGLACRCADRIVLDTDAHADMIRDLYDLDEHKMAAVFVGAEPNAFTAAAQLPSPAAKPLRVLFYGQFIPLHGVLTILGAAKLARDLPIEWEIIGTGQEADSFRSALDDADLPWLHWTDWTEYHELNNKITEADLCLGIFGTSEKAARVIPNKVFQTIAAGKPLITRDSPAMRELIGEQDEGVQLVPPGDPAALLDAVNRFATLDPGFRPATDAIAQRFSAAALAERWRQIVEATIAEDAT